ncbi:MAG: hypothetical protein H7Y32_10015 [Chloroflexales bacterium]|nr:hypothetical protein [Chloroflexales bacterium]
MRRLMVLAALLVFALGALPAQAATGPTLKLTSPTSEVAIVGSTVTVEFATSDWKIVSSQVDLSDYGMMPELNRPNEGHVHLSLDLWPLVVWQEAGAYTFTNVPPGEHQLKVELANNDHSSLNPPVVQVVRFRTTAAAGTAAPTTMPRTAAGDVGAVWNPALLLVALLLAAAGFFVRRRAAWRS